MFEKLIERWIVSGKIRTEKPLHIVRGRGDKDLGESDLPVLKYPNGELYIPGSSLKGAIRSEFDRIVRGLGFELCISGEPRYNCSPPKLCVSCALFGSTEVSSRIIFRDAVSKSTETFTRTGIAIDRSLKKVSTGALYEAEFVPPNTDFNFEIVLENPKKWMFGILWIVIENLVGIGGQISRGAGKVKFNIEKIEILTPYDIINSSKKYVEDIEEFVRACIEEFRTNLENLKEEYSIK